MTVLFNSSRTTCFGLPHLYPLSRHWHCFTTGRKKVSPDLIQVEAKASKHADIVVHKSLLKKLNMQQIEITAAMVIQAGQKLEEENQNVTGFALREMVGGGSPGKLRRVWEEHVNPTHNHQMHVFELHSEEENKFALVAKSHPEEFIKFAVDINKKAIRSVDIRIQEIQRSHDVQRQQLEAEMHEAANLIDALDSRLGEAVDLNLQLGRKLFLFESIFKLKNIQSAN